MRLSLGLGAGWGLEGGRSPVFSYRRPLSPVALLTGEVSGLGLEVTPSVLSFQFPCGVSGNVMW